MIAKNYIELPTEGLVRGSMLDEGNAVTVYLDVHDDERTEMVMGDEVDSDGNPTSEYHCEVRKVKVGYAVRCEKPVSREGFINAAEMLAYGLRDEKALASFYASLSRKARNSEDSDEVKEHDEFVAWVKSELDKVEGSKDDLVIAKEQKTAEITAYDTTSSVNGFVLNGALVWLDKSTRVGLMNSTNISKAAGLEKTTLWLGSLKLEVDCDMAIQMLSALELYALECFNVTAAHKKAVTELTSVEEVLAYNYRTGYPAMLKLEV